MSRRLLYEIKFRQYLAAVGVQLGLLSDIKLAAEAENVSDIKRAATELKRAKMRKDQIALDLGFAKCGSE